MINDIKVIIHGSSLEDQYNKEVNGERTYSTKIGDYETPLCLTMDEAIGKAVRRSYALNIDYQETWYKEPVKVKRRILKYGK